MVAKWLPGFKPTEVERSTRTDGTVMYELSGKLGGVDVDMEMAADGSKLLINDDTRG